MALHPQMLRSFRLPRKYPPPGKSSVSLPVGFGSLFGKSISPNGVRMMERLIVISPVAAGHTKAVHSTSVSNHPSTGLCDRLGLVYSSSNCYVSCTRHRRRPSVRLHGQNERLPGMATPLRPGLSCFAPSPGGDGSRPLRASIPIAGAPPASRRFLARVGARSPQGRVSAWTGCATARMGSGGDGAKARSARAGHRPLPTSPAFAWGGGSSSQTSSPGNTMPLTRLPSASTARKT